MTALQHRTAGAATAVTGRKVRRAGAATTVTKVWRRAAGVGVVVADWSAPAVTDYTMDWSAAGLNSWRAQANASALARDTTRYAGGALQWTATAAGISQVEHAGEIAVTPGSVLTINAKVSHNGVAARGFFLAAVAFSSDYGAQNNFASAWQYVDPGVTGATISYTFTVPAARTLLGFSVGIGDPAAGEQGWLDTYTITH